MDSLWDGVVAQHEGRRVAAPPDTSTGILARRISEAVQAQIEDLLDSINIAVPCSRVAVRVSRGDAMQDMLRNGVIIDPRRRVDYLSMILTLNECTHCTIY